MLQEVKVSNFQKHKSLSVKFGPNVTLIAGPTSSGKSSLFRAIRWVALHLPSTGITTHNQTETKVGLKTSRGSVIRFKGKENGYIAGGNKYVACRTDQPEDVTAAIGLSDINLASQHDGFFLLQQTPGELAKSLNKIVDLASIDTTTAEINKMLVKQKATADVLADQKLAADAGLSKLDWVAGAYVYGEFMQRNVASHNLAVESKATLSELLNALTKATKTLIDAVEARDALQAISALQTRQRGLQEVVLRLEGVVDEQYPDMAKIAADLEALKKNYTILLSCRKSYDALDVRYIPEGMYEAMQTLLALKPRRAQISELHTSIKLTIGEYEDICSQIDVIEAGIATTTKAIGETCPTCGKPLK